MQPIMKTWLRQILIGSGLVVFASGFFSVTSAQKKVFSHFTNAHRQGKYASCSSCHSMPTKNWMATRTDKTEPFPDVATFPSHTSCFGCHTKDIYSNGGAIFANSHTVPTMRARALEAFPINSHPTPVTSYFPHDPRQHKIPQHVPKP